MTKVDVSKGRTHRDFGRGFYTTTLKSQAHNWAWALSQSIPGQNPAVVRFDVSRDDLAGLDCLFFVLGDPTADDFWSLVGHCRMGGTDHARTSNQGLYDIVVGPIAAFWQQRLTIYNTDQISFHTDRAAAVLDAGTPTRII